MTKNAPRTPPKAPKLSPRGRSWRHHGPSWAQLAANLAHLASILGPSSPQLRQKSPPNLQEAPPDIPRRPRESPEGSRTAPRASISMVSGSILDFICRSISKDLTQFATHVESNFKAAGLARWRLCARSALVTRRPAERWSGVCRSRCPACPISNYQLYLMVPKGPPRALKCPRQPPT